MEVRIPQRAMPLHQIPVAAVFGTLEGGRYMRFLKLASDARDGVPVVSLGPSIDAQHAGPTAFFLDFDTLAYLEEKTIISPKRTGIGGDMIEPSRPAQVPNGAIIIGSDGDTYLYCRARPGERAMVNLATGSYRGPNANMALYEHYLLIMEDELGQKTVVFDSSKEEQARAAA